ncbi:hypothetical protein BDR06DRAFT_1007432 [Suillus hirtellus]|nr:hypothetical protein BDR06DRAFT_1007432 [Suillus hirtellus]
MAEGWRFECQEQIILWQEQAEEDAHILQKQLEHENAEKEAKQLEEQCEVEKKKPKINDFNAGAVMADLPRNLTKANSLFKGAQANQTLQPVPSTLAASITPFTNVPPNSSGTSEPKCDANGMQRATWSIPRASNSAMTGKDQKGVPTQPIHTSTNALDAE